jgi:hypothetical protein
LFKFLTFHCPLLLDILYINIQNILKEALTFFQQFNFFFFFNLDLLRSHEGFHLLHMEEFLAKEGVTGGLKGQLPPGNSSEAWGSELWKYLNQVCTYICMYVSMCHVVATVLYFVCTLVFIFFMSFIGQFISSTITFF